MKRNWQSHWHRIASGEVLAFHGNVHQPWSTAHCAYHALKYHAKRRGKRLCVMQRPADCLMYIGQPNTRIVAGWRTCRDMVFDGLLRCQDSSAILREFQSIGCPYDAADIYHEIHTLARERAFLELEAEAK